jgi:hypothetical protein
LIDESEFVAVVSTGLEALKVMQALGASNLPAHLQPLDQADFRSAALGMFVELGELVNESHWKPWRHYDRPTPAERQRVLKEFGDVLHFLAWMLNNLRERFDIEASDVAVATFEAHRENVARFRGLVPGREPPPENSGWKQVELPL